MNDSLEERLVKHVVYANWAIFVLASSVGLYLTPAPFAMGIICGGLITVVNFHLLSRTLQSALDPRPGAGNGAVVGKYYLRFLVSGALILALLVFKIVHPIGLFVGLSVVVAGILMALILELKYVFSKEAR
ncbi:MAG: ATP synthase subunit I [Desulfatibacillum sp.]|nr:ATP synthase subunit I [Desulfatibacillum sp.]